MALTTVGSCESSLRTVESMGPGLPGQTARYVNPANRIAIRHGVAVVARSLTLETATA
jgi:hypothetical protein